MASVCSKLSYTSYVYKLIPYNLLFRISVHPVIVGGDADVEADAHHRSVLVRAMEPLRHLYGFTDARITGLENASLQSRHPCAY